MNKREKFESMFQEIMMQYSYGYQKDVLFSILIRKFALDIQKPMHDQLEILLERKLTREEADKVTTLAFLRHHGMNRNGSLFFRAMLLVLLVVFGSQAILYSSANIGPLPYPTNENTSSIVSPSLQPLFTDEMQTPTIESSIRETSTPPLFPTPFRGAAGTNLPYRFEVVQWHDNYVVCDKDSNNTTVIIYGVVFANGTPPYEYHFSFWRFFTIATPIGLTPTPIFTTTPAPSPLSDNPFNQVVSFPGEYVVFDKPVYLLKGEYYHVIISFEWEKGNATWIDDIFYPVTDRDSRCPKN